MGSNLDKALKTVATLALCVIAVQLIPISKRHQLEYLCSVNNSIKTSFGPRSRKLSAYDEIGKNVTKIESIAGYSYKKNSFMVSDFCSELKKF
ncbi:hypothetical protein [Prochlorococcus sp. MIT 1307]|uniref:hypothetical protein n=1 Tax=Prochlorococcus sp. MIT 1307 TaxID=3096219 RepID=UPI002A760CDB|nr:hypothetical protein [Prochlorococcus sp. MIT 1307]